jgi:hypothetical protein
MRRKSLSALALSLPIAWLTLASLARSAELPAFEASLQQGNTADAERQLETHLAANPQDDNARFALGFVQCLRAVERTMQSLYHYGLEPPRYFNMPILRLPVSKNPNPEPITNEEFRQIVAGLSSDLAAAEATLAKIESDDVKLPLAVGTYRLDFDASGEAADFETLWRVLARLTNTNGINSKEAAGFVIAADKADVHWLRGYCHVLQAFCEMLLAHDTQEIHDHCAHLFFPEAKMRYPVERRRDDDSWSWVADVIAFIHLLRLPVAEPERLKTAHGHLLAVIDESRESWQAIDAETDDDREWIPSPDQKNVAIPGARISGEMVKGWQLLLDEAEAILKGEKLAPFWRGNDARGINLKRVFHEPQTFDLVLWVQGSAAIPYLEEGEVTDPQRWRTIQRSFGGRLFWFAVWVN